ncbi:MAG: hypothetical protein L0Z55_00365, partial [Planctomycetes bacterium]|nr:hypothetical protein [Planctomycetota bacterium]
AVDPVELMLRSIGRVPDPAPPVSAIAPQPSASPASGAAQPEPLAPQVPQESQAPQTPRPAAGASGRGRARRREHDMLLGVRQRLESAGAAERARRRARARWKALARERRALIRRGARLERERDEAQESARHASPQKHASAASALAAAGASWLAGLDTAPPDTAAHRAEWEELLRAFHTRGAIDAKRVDRLAAALAEAAPLIGARIGLFLESDATGFAGERWNATLLVLSVLVREARESARIHAALGTVFIAALIEYAPGARPAHGECREGLEQQVAKLLGSVIAPRPTVGGAGRNGESHAESHAESQVRADIALWRAAVRVAAAGNLCAGGWRIALGAVLSGLEDGAPERAGIRRLLETHSLYLPGCWVELTTGGIGPVLGALPARPELPLVLVLFRRHGERCTPTAPKLFPAEGDAGSSVLRVLRSPRLFEQAPAASSTVASPACTNLASNRSQEENVAACPTAGRVQERIQDTVEGFTT